MNLSYEWSIIRGRRPYQPTIWVRDQLPFYFVIQGFSPSPSALSFLSIDLPCCAPVLPLSRGP